MAAALIRWAAAGLAAVTLQADAQGPVPVEVVDRDQTYAVDANSAEGLAAQMAERGPQHPFGRRAWAYTAWELRAPYTLERGKAACRIGETRVVLVVTITLPAWTPHRPAPHTLRSAWARMRRKAGEHEAVHRTHGIEAAHDAASRIAAIEPDGNCITLERAVRSALRAAIRAAGDRSRAFDLETNYGQRQGVRL